MWNLSWQKSLLFFPLLWTTLAHANETATENNPTPQELLQQMQKAQDYENYRISFVNLTAEEVESLRYYHAFAQSTAYAQLATLDGPQQEIIQRGDIISYFAPNAQPFSLPGLHIVDKFPNILRADLAKVSQNYDIVPMGLNRIADRLVQSFHILPKDGLRYQLAVFLDIQTHLLLRRDVLDRQGNLLQQFRVVNIAPFSQEKEFIQALTELKLPPLLPDAEHEKNTLAPKNNSFSWQPAWLPKGFKLIHSRLHESQGSVVESQFYSDGLFSFTLNRAPSIIQNAPEKSWNKGMLTLYTQTRGNVDFTCIGQIPSTTAKRIIEEIKDH